MEAAGRPHRRRLRRLTAVSNPSRFQVPLAHLVDSVRVPLDEQVEEHDSAEAPQHDESAGHLPGNVRPYGA